MPDIIVRDWLEAQLRPLLPKRYQYVSTQRTIDHIVKPLVMFKQERIGRQIIEGKTVPGGRIVGATMTIAVPYEDTGNAERALDDDIITLLDAIDRIGNVRWTTAEKRIWTQSGQEPCYDIALEVPYQHTKE